MFHFNHSLKSSSLILCCVFTGLLVLASWSANAADEAASSAQGDESKMVYSANSQWGLYLGYMSWQENLTLQSGSTQDYGFANFSGNNLDLSYEFYFSRAHRHGFRFDGGFDSGVTTAGGAQAVLSYQVANLAWTAETASALYVFQLSPTITLGAGPFLLARQISYQTMGAVSASSGANLNFGGEGSVRASLTQHWALQLLFAGLSSNATTLWDFSLGYLF